MKRVIALILSITLLPLYGCGLSKPKQYSKTYYDLFDTVTTLTAQVESEAQFLETAAKIRDELLEYHKLFDIYNSYPGLVNLNIINETAGIAPTHADSRIIDLLLFCKDVYTVTNGKVNAAMGSVLHLWHQARDSSLDVPEAAFLPDQKLLDAAATHMDFDAVIIDQDAATVSFSDPHIRLDVGAVAKGWAIQKVAQNAPAGWLLNVGGNVVATGPKANGSPWNVAIQSPWDPEEYLHSLSVNSGCVVTSGDYQRSYQLDGVNYHHIIDPQTLYPARLWRSVTVVCDDSGIADMLSTALFLMDRSGGQLLLNKYGAKALWVDAGNKITYSPGFEELIQT